MKTVLVIDGQGGKLGKTICEGIKKNFSNCTLLAVGTNSIATSAMQKGGADLIATGENSILVCSKRADVIIGPIGIVIADSLLGEITPAVSVAVGQSRATKILLPISKCNNMIAGVGDCTFGDMVDDALSKLKVVLEG